jgi:RNA polymerase sigma-70 factor (ECF subfamily)
MSDFSERQERPRRADRGAADASADGRTAAEASSAREAAAAEEASSAREAEAAEQAEVALDHALIRRAIAGEEAAFESLVRRHQQRAWRIARNLVPTDEDAQDLAQEAFVRVFKSLANFDFGHAFTTWLYRIVTNLAIDHLRRRRPAMSTARSEKDEESEFDIVDTRAKAPSASLESRELSEDVRATLASLAPHFQSVLLLREMEGLPCNEIAHIVGATHVTVRWRLHRGRKLFQEEWERRARLREKGGDRTIETGRLEVDGDDADANPFGDGEAHGAGNARGRASRSGNKDDGDQASEDRSSARRGRAQPSDSQQSSGDRKKGPTGRGEDEAS